MKENIGIRTVAGFFAVGGVLLLPEGIFMTILSFGPIGYTDYSPTGTDRFVALVFSVLVVLFSVYAIVVSSGLHKLQTWAYKGAFALLAVFLLSSVALSFLQNFSESGVLLKVIVILITILIVSLAIGITLYINRNRFSVRQGIPTDDVGLLEH